MTGSKLDREHLKHMSGPFYMGFDSVISHHIAIHHYAKDLTFHVFDCRVYSIWPKVIE